jgi:hypothetical protein
MNWIQITRDKPATVDNFLNGICMNFYLYNLNYDSNNFLELNYNYLLLENRKVP